ncbi:hypothetical protein BC828DRAFT_394879 [Blastocladiella britannica]|nr:hypothetical protein BC828DRAFT_394879 [Blastocladiella britannica]
MTSSRPRRSAAAAAAASAGAYTPKDSDFEEEDDEEQLVTYTQTQKAPAKNQGSPKDDDGDDSTMPIGFLFGRFGPSLLERLMADEGITSFSEVVSTSATPASSVTPTPVKRVRGPRLVVKEEDLRRSSRHTSTNKRQHSESRGSGDDESDYAPERKSYRTGTGHGRTKCGVHGPPVGGIAGTEESGAVSICDNSGYDGGQESDNDGNVIEYCGSGGRDLSGNKRVADQTKDQQLTGFNLVLANAVDLGLPVRVLRGSKSKSRYRPAPDAALVQEVRQSACIHVTAPDRPARAFDTPNVVRRPELELVRAVTGLDSSSPAADHSDEVDSRHTEFSQYFFH